MKTKSVLCIIICGITLFTLSCNETKKKQVQPKQTVIVHAPKPPGQKKKSAAATSKKQQPDSGQTRIDYQQKPSSFIENDYQKLLEMWDRINRITTEREVEDYILKNAPLRIKGAKTAGESLEKISRWHKNWSAFDDLPLTYQLKAQTMLAQIQGSVGNTCGQLKMYRNILEQMRKSQIERFKMPLPDSTEILTETLEKIIENNTQYLILNDAFESDRRLSLSLLNSIEHRLMIGELTLLQQLKASYMLGDQYQRRIDVYVPTCFYFGKTLRFMEANEITRTELIPEKSIILEVAELKKKVCFYCSRVEQYMHKVVDHRQLFRTEQYRKYQSLLNDLAVLLDKCPKDAINQFPPVRENRSVGKRDAEVNHEEILKFLDAVSSYIKKLTVTPKDSAKQEIIMMLMKSQHDGVDFEVTRQVYRDKIPAEYDAEMNRFFYILYTRKPGWKEYADQLIVCPQWHSNIKKKIRKILDELKTIYD